MFMRGIGLLVSGMVVGALGIAAIIKTRMEENGIPFEVLYTHDTDDEPECDGSCSDCKMCENCEDRYDCKATLDDEDELLEDFEALDENTDLCDTHSMCKECKMQDKCSWYVSGECGDIKCKNETVSKKQAGSDITEEAVEEKQAVIAKSDEAVNIPKKAVRKKPESSKSKKAVDGKNEAAK